MSLFNRILIIFTIVIVTSIGCTKAVKHGYYLLTVPIVDENAAQREIGMAYSSEKSHFMFFRPSSGEVTLKRHSGTVWDMRIDSSEPPFTGIYKFDDHMQSTLSFFKNNESKISISSNDRFVQKIISSDLGLSVNTIKDLTFKIDKFLKVASFKTDENSERPKFITENYCWNFIPKPNRPCSYVYKIFKVNGMYTYTIKKDIDGKLQTNLEKLMNNIKQQKKIDVIGIKTNSNGNYQIKQGIKDSWSVVEISEATCF